MSKTDDNPILITSYINPDLDGVAGAYAYAEFLSAPGKNAIAVAFGAPHTEAQFSLNRFHIKLPDGEKLYKKSSKVILIDVSEPNWLSSTIDPKNVIEVIDHRKVHTVEKFSNAKSQIELVGACATLVAERLIEANFKMSKEAAAMLYLAIASNTINFKAKVTTDRDRGAAKYLKAKGKVTDELLHEMFKHKSTFIKPLKEVFDEDNAVVYLGPITQSIIQLEIVEVDKFIDENLAEIKKILNEIKKRDKLNYIYLTCIDIEKGENTFVVADKDSEEVFSKIMNLRFINGVVPHPIIMRKEMIAMFKEYFEGKK